MRREPVDRCPCVPLIDTSYAAACLGVPVSQCFLNPGLHARALACCLERHSGIDGVSINIGLTPDVIVRRKQYPGSEEFVLIDGTVWKVEENDVGASSVREVTSFTDERLRLPNVFRGHIVDTLRAMPKHLVREYNILTGLTGPYSQVFFTMGPERVLTAMNTDPDALLAAIEARMPDTLAWIEEMAELNVPSVWIGEGAGSNSLISPSQYEKFVLPFEHRVVDALHARGIPVVIHICGKASRMLEAIASTGADCFEADWPIDLDDAARRVGGRLSFKGNLHTTWLMQAKPEEVFERSRALVEARRGRGMLLSSGCSVARDTPPENIDAMAAAVRAATGA
jgi:uroporphyrinogen-III decarboxylase